MEHPDPLIDPVVLRGGTSPLAGMTVSPDGRWIATSNEGGNSVALWSTGDPRNPLVRFPIRGESHSLAYSNDGHWLVTTSEVSGRISLLDLRNLSTPPIELREDSTSDYKSLNFSRDSRLLVSGTWAGDVTMWDVSGDHPTTTPSHHCQQGAGVRLRPTFSPDGRYVATASTVWEARAFLWDLTSPDPCADPLMLDPHKKNDSRFDTAYEVQFSPHKRWAAFASWDKTTKLIDLTRPTATPVQLAGHAARILALAFTPDGRWLVTGSEDRTVRIWDVTDLSTAPVVLRGHGGQRVRHRLHRRRQQDGDRRTGWNGADLAAQT